MAESGNEGKEISTRDWYDFIGSMANVVPALHLGGVEAMCVLLKMCALTAETSARARRDLRSYIFTDKELEIINSFLETGVRLNGFTQLRHRIREHWPRICKDITVAMRFVAEFHEEFRRYAEECKNFQEILTDYSWSDFISEEEP